MWRGSSAGFGSYSASQYSVLVGIGRPQSKHPMSEGNAMNISDVMDPADARNILLNAESDDVSRLDVRSVIVAGLSLDQELTRVARELESLRARTRSLRSADTLTTQVEGHPLVEGRDGGGPRHYLAGRPVHAGNPLYLLTLLGWMAARYEWGYRPGTPCKLYVRLPGARNAMEIRYVDDALLAWPDQINSVGENSRRSPG
jgi:hypothetical protein